jgi:hypothetical protein
MLDSIEPALLTAVVGGGLSLGDRDAPPASDNGWAALLDKKTFPSENFDGTIDRGMRLAPENPTMDSDIWRQPYSGDSSPIDI